MIQSGTELQHVGISCNLQKNSTFKGIKIKSCESSEKKGLRNGKKIPESPTESDDTITKGSPEGSLTRELLKGAWRRAREKHQETTQSPKVINRRAVTSSTPKEPRRKIGFQNPQES